MDWLKTRFWRPGGQNSFQFLPGLPEAEIQGPTRVFPKLLDLSVLAQRAYDDCSGKELGTYYLVDYGLPAWSLIATADFQDGYRGAAYWNKAEDHVVIAHKGTQLKEGLGQGFKDVILTDVIGVVFNGRLPFLPSQKEKEDVSQIVSAIIFTLEIASRYSNKAISATGHSLGGWLTQICALYAEHPIYLTQNSDVVDVVNERRKALHLTFPELTPASEPKFSYHLHCVVFESPGCAAAFRRITGMQTYNIDKKQEWSLNVETLDITIVLAASNVVNTQGIHVGYVAHAVPTNPRQVYMFSSHYMENLVEHFKSANPEFVEIHETGRFKSHQVGDRNKIIVEDWYLGRKNCCSSGIFSGDEREWISDIQKLGLWWNENKDLKEAQDLLAKPEHSKTLAKILEEIKPSGVSLKFCLTAGMFHNNDLSSTSESISKLIQFLRNFKEQLKKNVMRKAIGALPNFKQMIYQIESKEYLDKIPQLKSCAETIANTIQSFLNSTTHIHLLNLEVRPPLSTRICMTHVVSSVMKFHSFQPHPEISKLGVLFCNTFSLESMNRYMVMERIFHESKLSLIVIEVDSKTCEERITKLLKNGATSGKKVILITNPNVFISDVDGLQRCDEVVNETSQLQFGLKDLEQFSLDKILNSELHIQGTFVSLRHFLDSGSDSICDLFHGCQDGMTETICRIYDGEICGVATAGLPERISNYIPRRLYKLVLDVESVKGEFPGKIIISCLDYDSEKARIEAVLGDIFQKFCAYGNSASQDPSKTEYKSSNPLHWFKWDNNYLVWQTSAGASCSKFLKLAGELKDLEILELENQFAILADEPGMGKSATIINLFLNYRTKFQEGNVKHLPIYLDLSRHKADLKIPTVSIEPVIAFLTKSIEATSEFVSCLLRFSLKNNRHFAFFIDSFDELSNDGQVILSEIINKLVSMNSNVRILIATRIHAKHGLEKALKTKAHCFYVMTIDERRDFLMDYFKVRLLEYSAGFDWEKHQSKFSEFTTHILQSVMRIVGEKDPFIGIPLQLVFLGLINWDGVKQLAKDLKENAFSEKVNLAHYAYLPESRLDLYEMFVRKKLLQWLYEKNKLQESSDWIQDELLGKIDLLHCKAAMISLGSSIFQNKLFEIFVGRINPSDFGEMNRVGLCGQMTGSKRTMHIPKKLFENLQRKTETSKGKDIIHVTVLPESNSPLSNEEKGNISCWIRNFLFVDVEFEESDKVSVRDETKCIHWFRENLNMELIWQRSSQGNYIGIELEVVSQDSFQFKHQTLGEFYCAKYLVTRINNNENHVVLPFLKEHYYQTYFRNVRYFLDSFIYKESFPELKNLDFLKSKQEMKERIPKLEDVIKMYSVQTTDVLGRRILHYAAAYGDHKHGIVWIIALTPKSLLSEDELGVNFMSYALLADYFQDLNYALFFEGCKKWNKFFYSIFLGSRFAYDLLRHEESGFCRNYANELNHLANLNIPDLILQINIKWLNENFKSHRAWDFMQLLYLHAKNAENFKPYYDYLFCQFSACLDISNERGYDMAEYLCRVWKHPSFRPKPDDQHYDFLESYKFRVLEKIKSNLPDFYGLILIKRFDDQSHFDLWKSCSTKEREIFLNVSLENKFVCLWTYFTTKKFSNKEFANALVDQAKKHGENQYRNILNALCCMFDLAVFNRNACVCEGILDFIPQTSRKDVWNRNFKSTSSIPLRNPHNAYLSIQSFIRFSSIFMYNDNEWVRKYSKNIDDSDVISILFTIEHFNSSLELSLPKESIWYQQLFNYMYIS